MNTQEKMEKMPKEDNPSMITVSNVTVRQSLSFLIFRLITIEFLAAVGLISAYYAFLTSGFIQQLFNEQLIFTITIFGLTVLLKTMLTIYVVLDWVEEYYKITPHEVIHKKGLIFKSQEKYKLEHLASLEITQGIFGRIFNYGTIKMFNWATEKDVLLYLIHNPLKYGKILKDLLPNVDEESKVFRERVFEED